MPKLNSDAHIVGFNVQNIFVHLSVRYLNIKFGFSCVCGVCLYLFLSFTSNNEFKDILFSLAESRIASCVSRFTSHMRSGHVLED